MPMFRGVLNHNKFVTFYKDYCQFNTFIPNLENQ